MRLVDCNLCDLLSRLYLNSVWRWGPGVEEIESHYTFCRWSPLLCLCVANAKNCGAWESLGSRGFEIRIDRKGDSNKAEFWDVWSVIIGTCQLNRVRSVCCWLCLFVMVLLAYEPWLRKTIVTFEEIVLPRKIILKIGFGALGYIYCVCCSWRPGNVC